MLSKFIAFKSIIRKFPKIHKIVSCVFQAGASALNRFPPIRQIVSERDQLRSAFGYAPPGHFYSPIPSLEDIRRDESLIFGSVPRSIPGLELHEAEQFKLLETLVKYYEEMPFPPQKTNNKLRYYFENPAYGYLDGILLYCMIRHLKPKRIIEIGSGFSSCVTLDTNELFFDGSIANIFIDPYPDQLLSLIKEKDKNKIRIIPDRLQEVNLSEFEALEANDILFVDSTHVSKINSDVNRIFFDILPSLSSGVFIHFHDIFFPFEYPKEWIYEGRAWNEAYMLRAFLQYNSQFQVVLMSSFMHCYHGLFFQEHMPLGLKNPGGNIWLRKI